MRYAPSPAEEFVCCAVADDAVWHAADLGRLYERLGDAAAWNVAARNGCASIVARSLEPQGIGGTAGGKWAAAASEVAARINHYMCAVDRIAARLAEIGIPLVALKNAGIARGIYRDLAACPMGDVDLLVRRRDFPRAHALLLQLGAAFDSRSPLGELDLPEAERSGGAEYRLPLPDGSAMWLELQWRPVSGRWITEAQEPAADDLVARSVAVEGTHVRLLCPEDNLLQVCLHTAKHSYVRAPGFRLHTDVDRIVRRQAVNWDLFAGDVERRTVRTPVYFSLALAAALLRTPVPAGVLERLRPRPWKRATITRMLLRAGLFDPDAPKWGRAEYIAFNALLYDSPRALSRAVVPSRGEMERRYGPTSAWQIPFVHARRLYGLLTRRART